MRTRLQKLALSFLACLACVVTGQAQSSPSSILGKTDIQALLEAVPGVPNSTSEAATRAYGADIRMYDVPVKLDDTYQPFFQQAASAHARMKDAMNARAKNAPDQATVMKQAKDQANASPIVAGMGGLDNVARMTPEQRQQAARQSAAAFQQNLITGGGRNSPGMQAMMQKVMSDPEYRTRFQKMSEPEKEAEMRKFMGNAPVASATPPDQPSRKSQAGSDVATAMAIRSDLQKMAAKLGEIDVELRRKDAAISSSKGSHQDIANEINAKIEKVPVVELGEYGHDRDPEKVTALLKEQATRDRDRATLELLQRSAIYNQRKTQYKELATEYQTWLKQNLARINTSLATPLSNTNTELDVASYEDGLIAMSENLAKYSLDTTKDAARYEKQYQDKLSNQNMARPTRTRKKAN